MADPLTLGLGAVAWAITILGWFSSPYITRRVNNYFDASEENNLQNLENKVLELNQMLEKALQLRFQDETKLEGLWVKKLELWVKNLRSAFYDTEDIMDAIDYHRLKSKAMSHRQSVNARKRKTTTEEDFRFPLGSKEKLSKNLKIIEKLIEEGERLVKLLDLNTSGGNIKSSPEQTTGSGSRSPSKTTSEPPKVFGRDGDTENIISMLHDTTADPHSVIGIHGMSGSGKTTLAQYVCECEKNTGVPYFELIMWIHVTKNFSVDTIYKEMLEIVPGEKMEGDTNNLDKLQSELKKRLQGKRVLLVLDDVWYSKNVRAQDDLVKLLSPLKESDKASRVLFTSRTADTAKLLGAPNPMEISDMDEEESFKMFMYYAFDNSGVSDQDRVQFDILGRDISKLLRKSPMAMKTVGRQLKRRTSEKKHSEYWKNILIQKHDLLKHTMGALWWSYNELEEHVRQCFAYCSMFPTRYELKQEELVKMWMAQGLVDTSKYEDIELAARECFDVLLSTSFIQLHKTPAGKEYYTIHDLMHDLAERVAGSDFFRTEKGTMGHKIPEDVRHLFIDSDNFGELMKQIVGLKTLRTLVMSISAKEIKAGDFELILKRLKKLRFVHVFLEELQQNVIPDCIGELQHLRYLGLYGVFPDPDQSTTIMLPSTFVQLYHLQELLVPFATHLHCPRRMAHLVNLRSIAGLELSIPHIGQMKWLRTLGGFTVKKEEGYEITQLENLNKIRGRLSIKGLENIKSKDDALRAKLSKKIHITDLSFTWGKQILEAAAPPNPEEILEALHPPALLSELSFWNYDGSTFPSWLSGEDGKLKRQEDLSFQYCHGSSSELKFSKPLPMLHRLEINNCRNIQSLPELPSSLKILQTRKCKNIKALPDLPQSLEELIIYGCEVIQSPPRLPSSLKKLCIQGCLDISTLLELSPSSLEELIIYDFENILPSPRLPSSLKKLQIMGCLNIKILLDLPQSLVEFKIKECQYIESPPGLPSSLKKLKIKICRNIKTLLELPSSLEELQIKDCSKIQSLPGLPPSLKKLWIKDCPNIQSRPALPPHSEFLWEK